MVRIQIICYRIFLNFTDPTLQYPNAMGTQIHNADIDVVCGQYL
jgi:hypothetical protein